MSEFPYLLQNTMHSALVISPHDYLGFCAQCHASKYIWCPIMMQHVQQNATLLVNHLANRLVVQLVSCAHLERSTNNDTEDTTRKAGPHTLTARS